MQNQNVYKIIVIGDVYVGKTCLTYRFCENKFYDTAECTIGIDFREKQVNVDGDVIRLQFWDTAGQERYRSSIPPTYYRNVDAIILVYDMTNMKSFIALDKWLSECSGSGIEKVVKILIGNKCDSDNIVVSTAVAQRFSDQYNLPFFETSAKLDSEAEFIESIFLTLAHKLKNDQAFKIRELSLSQASTTAPTGTCC